LFSSAKGMSAMEKEAAALYGTMSDDEFEKAMDSKVAATRTATAEAGKLIDKHKELNALMNRVAEGEDITIQEEQRMLDLMEERIKAQNGRMSGETAYLNLLDDQATVLAQHRREQELALIAAEARGDQAVAAVISAELGKIKAQMKDISKTLDGDTESYRMQVELMGALNSEQQAFIDNRRYEIRLAEKLVNSAKEANAVASEYADIQEEILTSVMNRLEKEQHAVKLQLAEEMKTLEIKKQYQVDELEVATRGLAEAQKNKIGNDIVYYTNQMRLAKANIDQIEKEEKQITKIRLGNMLDLHAEQRKSQADLSNDLYEEGLKLADRTLKLDLHRAKEEHKDAMAKINEEFIMASQGHIVLTAAETVRLSLKKKEAEVLARNILQLKIRNAHEKESEKQAKAAGKAKAGKAITSGLQKRVKTLKELITLMQIRAKLRQHAERTMLKAMEMRRRVDKLKTRGASDENIERAEIKAATALADAQSTMEMFGMDPALLDKIKIQSAASAIAVRARIVAIRDEILLFTNQAQAMGEKLGQNLFDGLKPKIEEMIEFVKIKMEEMRRSLDPDTKHSLSLRETMQKSSSVVANALRSMGESIGRAPNLAEVSGGMARQVSASGASSMSGGTFTDNRNMNLTVNNKYDLDEMMRQVNMRFNRNRTGVS